MYNTLAHHYDWIGIDDFAQQMLVRDVALFQEWGLGPGTTILDLACGTGTLAIAMAEKGYSVIGIDRSQAMLAQAKRKSLASHHAPIHWVQGDMRAFSLDGPVDVVVCHCDSLNHLTMENDFIQSIQAVARALKPQGYFLFDLNTLDNFQQFWNGSDTEEGPNCQLSTLALFDPATHLATARFTCREYNDSGRLVTIEETVSTRFYPEAWVNRILIEAGFTGITSSPLDPFESHLTDQAKSGIVLKTFWQCRLA